jgi:glycosyltransferase involved in cell wall biosynthesis
MAIPLISVIVPLYNHAQYIEATIASVRSQTHKNFELVVVDDGSTDTSPQLVKSVDDPRVFYVYQENQGAHAAINNGIALSHGDYISILNSDDLYAPDRLETCLKTINTDERIDAVFSFIDYIDESGLLLKSSDGTDERWKSGWSKYSFSEDHPLYLQLLQGNFLKTTSNLFCKRSVFSRFGVFRNLRYCHDYDFFLRLAFAGKAELIHRQLLQYRVHGGNTLKEDSALVDFECAWVIADFLFSHDILNGAGESDTATITRLFNGVHVHNGERIVMALLYWWGLRECSGESRMELLTDADHPFRRDALLYLRNHMDGWSAREKIYNDWHHLHEESRAVQQRLAAIESSIGYRFYTAVKRIFNR